MCFSENPGDRPEENSDKSRTAVKKGLENGGIRSCWKTAALLAVFVVIGLCSFGLIRTGFRLAEGYPPVYWPHPWAVGVVLTFFASLVGGFIAMGRRKATYPRLAPRVPCPGLSPCARRGRRQVFLPGRTVGRSRTRRCRRGRMPLRRGMLRNAVPQRTRRPPPPRHLPRFQPPRRAPRPPRPQPQPPHLVQPHLQPKPHLHRRPYPRPQARAARPSVSRGSTTGPTRSLPSALFCWVICFCAWSLFFTRVRG